MTGGNNIVFFLTFRFTEGPPKKFYVKDQNRISYLMIDSPKKTKRAKIINILKIASFVRTDSLWKLGLFLRKFLPGMNVKKSKRKRNLCL